MGVERVADGYLLRGGAMAYAFVVGREPALDEPVLRHLHWGAPITSADVTVLAEREPHRRRPSGAWSRPRAHDEEYVAHGGLRRDEAALVVEFADGVRDLRLAVREHHASGDTVTVVLADDHYPFEVELTYRVLADVDAIVRTTRLRNTGAEPVTVHRAASACWAPPPGDGYTLTTLSGAVLTETQVTTRPLATGRVVVETRAGTTGHEHQPWVALTADGAVWSAALEWSGPHRTVVQTMEDGGTHIVQGVNDLGQHHRLDPGATLTLPDSVGVYAHDGRSAQRWQRYAQQHVLRPGPRPVLYNSWEATHYDVRTEHQVQLASAARDLGVELFVVDDGWFREPHSDGTASLGDWAPTPGLREIADAVHGMGLRFGVWVEPENVNEDSDIYRAHPEWCYRWPTREPTLVPRLRRELVLDLTRAEVRDHLVATLDRLVTEVGVDFLKWDMNRPLTELSTPDQMTALAHTRGVYDVLDRLIARHPDLLIESCAAGGGRIDHGIFRRAHWAWASDNTDAVDRLFIQEGMSELHPAATMMCWVTDAPGNLTPRATPLRFRFHVAMCGLLGLGGDLLSMPETSLAEARSLIATYKEIRPVVQEGVSYRLGTAADEVFGVQYTHGDDIVVFAFARQVRHLLQRVELRLTDLDPSASYEDDAGRRHSGALLMSRGLYLTLAGDYVSELFRLRRV
jgi:alpha-galactosidase